MDTIIKIIIIVLCIALTILVLLQESKSDGLSGTIGGGAEQLFGKKRSKPLDRLFHKLTIVASVLILISACVGIFILG